MIFKEKNLTRICNQTPTLGLLPVELAQGELDDIHYNTS